ncbi:hypothetical protein [Pseudomonas sp. Irchel s3h17]|uniref:hypothetical protein n=1 Tax=Pseudomonas sp. Irchel s3h17 TaxID=2009182 RepID=UPI000BA3E13D|nr:hypothetical protein [Pseudomonas sp. Irchel s3h17]
MRGRKLWVVAFLAFLTHGAALLGVGQASAGSLARAIECNHNIARNIETAKAQGLLAGNPPCRSRSPIPGPFQVNCQSLKMCSALA